MKNMLNFIEKYTRLFLLLIILFGVLAVNNEIVFITSHYDYLEKMYTIGLNGCLKALESNKK